MLLTRDCGTQKNMDGTPMRKPAGESFFSIKDITSDNEFISEQNLCHHEKPLGKVRLKMKLVNQDKPPLDGAKIIERVLDNLVGPMSHLVYGWSDHHTSTAQVNHFVQVTTQVWSQTLNLLFTIKDQCTVVELSRDYKNTFKVCISCV